MDRMNVRRGFFVLSVSLAAASSALAGDFRYRVVDIAPGVDWARPLAINDSNQVTGYTYVGNTQQPFLASDGAFTPLTGLPGNWNSGEAINNRGQIAGWHYTMGVIMPEAYLWTNGAHQSLGNLGGRYSYGYGVNDLGQVVGFSYTAENSFVPEAFIFKNGVMRDIGPGAAMDINEAGLIVGGSSDSPFGSAVIWEPLGNSWERIEIGGGLVRAVNDAGTIAVGEGQTQFCFPPATYWTRQPDGSWTPTDITDPFSLVQAYIYDVNNAGQMVGSQFNPETCLQDAFIFENGHMTFLRDLIDPALGLTMYEAIGINEAGHITGWALNENFESIAVILMPDELSMLGPRPGLAGQRNSLIATGASAGERVFFAYGMQTGSTAVPGCPGLSVDIRNAALAGSAIADADGTARVEVSVPAAARNQSVLLQAVEADSCALSNVAIHTFR